MTATERPEWEAYESGYANWEGASKWHIATQDGRKKGPFADRSAAQLAADAENGKGK